MPQKHMTNHSPKKLKRHYLHTHPQSAHVQKVSIDGPTPPTHKFMCRQPMHSCSPHHNSSRISHATKDWTTRVTDSSPGREGIMLWYMPRTDIIEYTFFQELGLAEAPYTTILLTVEVPFSRMPQGCQMKPCDIGKRCYVPTNIYRYHWFNSMKPSIRMKENKRDEKNWKRSIPKKTSQRIYTSTRQDPFLNDRRTCKLASESGKRQGNYGTHTQIRQTPPTIQIQQHATAFQEVST